MRLYHWSCFCMSIKCPKNLFLDVVKKKDKSLATTFYDTCWLKIFMLLPDGTCLKKSIWDPDHLNTVRWRRTISSKVHCIRKQHQLLTKSNIRLGSGPSNQKFKVFYYTAWPPVNISITLVWVLNLKELENTFLLQGTKGPPPYRGWVV